MNVNEIESKILSFIKNHRIKRGLSQEYVAFKLGIEQSTYQKIENGKLVLKVTHLLKIAEILELKPHEIIYYSVSVERNKVECLIDEMDKIFNELKDKSRGLID